MVKLRLLFFLLLLALLAHPLAASSFDPLTLGRGARILGMGGAGVAAAEDGDIIFNNPAGLGEVNAFRFTSMSGNLLEDITYTSLGGIYPFGRHGVLGLGFSGSYISGIDLRDNLGNLNERRANFGSSVAFAALGRRWEGGLLGGLRLKYYFNDATEVERGDGQGWNLDFGLQQPAPGGLTFGLVAENLVGSGQVTYANGHTESPSFKVKGGGKWYLFGSGFRSLFPGNFELLAAAEGRYDSRHPQLGSSHFGLELSPVPELSFRAGSSAGHLTAGLSFRVAGLGFHYAYVPGGEFNNNVSTFFSLTFDERGWPAEGPADIFLGKI